MRFEKISYDTFNLEMYKYGFEPEKILDAYERITLPERKTKYSAGYDFYTPVDFRIKPFRKITIPTGIKVYFEPEEAEKWHLSLFIRSSIGIARGVVIANQTGIIDADYYDNEENEGDIVFALKNTNDFPVNFSAGTRLVQGIFQQHGITSDDAASGKRIGGVGSTGEDV